MISAILILCLVSLTPFPSLPLAIYYYSKFGFTEGFSLPLASTFMYCKDAPTPNSALAPVIVSNVKPINATSIFKFFINFLKILIFNEDSYQQIEIMSLNFNEVIKLLIV